MSAASWIGPAIIAAVISAVVTGFGWVISERQSIRRDAARRRERIADLQTALLAEIRADRNRIGNVERSAEDVYTTLDDRPDFVPFVPRRAPAVVFDALLREIHVLPNKVIDPVVIYHRQLATISLFVDDLRSDRFALLEPTRKRAMYQDYAELLIYANVLGQRAAIALAASLNMTDEGPSARRSGEARGGALEETPSQDSQVDAERSGDRSS